MSPEERRAVWKREEDCARIKGWDFSHIRGRYREEDALPWDYAAEIRGVLRDEMKLLDYDTGGGEFLLSLGHPYENTAATEGYPPNVKLCRERFAPLGVEFREMTDYRHMPFGAERFNCVINRHGDYDAGELRRVLKPGGKAEIKIKFDTSSIDYTGETIEVLSVITNAPSKPILNLFITGNVQ